MRSRLCRLWAPRNSYSELSEVSLVSRLRAKPVLLLAMLVKELHLELQACWRPRSHPTSVRKGMRAQLQFCLLRRWRASDKAVTSALCHSLLCSLAAGHAHGNMLINGILPCCVATPRDGCHLRLKAHLNCCCLLLLLAPW